MGLFTKSSDTMIFGGAAQPPSKPTAEKPQKKDKKRPREEAAAASEPPSTLMTARPANEPKQKIPTKAVVTPSGGPASRSEEKPKQQQREQQRKPAGQPPKQHQPKWSPEELAERNARTVFVGNVPFKGNFNADKKEITNHFRVHGAVETVYVRSAAKSDPALPMKAAVITGALDRTVRDSYNAYVVFKELASVAKAVAVNGELWQEHHLRITPAGGKRGSGAETSAPSAAEMKRSVFLGNLPFNVQEEEVRKLFVGCGDIANVRLVRDAATQQGKGFGYVLFREAGAVEIALAQHEKLDLVGPKGKPRPVRVFRCSAAKATKRAREAKETAAAKAGGGRGGGGDDGDGEGGSGGGSGSKGWQVRERRREMETKKAVKPKLSAAAKLKKEQKEKVETKRKHKIAKRSGGAPKGSIGKNGGAGKKGAGKKSGKPSSL